MRQAFDQTGRERVGNLHHDGDSLCHRLGDVCCRRCPHDKDIDALLDKRPDGVLGAFPIAIDEVDFDLDVLAFDLTKLAQSLAQVLDTSRSLPAHETEPSDLSLLRPRRGRPREMVETRESQKLIWNPLPLKNLQK
jgi:hypothetical protein